MQIQTQRFLTAGFDDLTDAICALSFNFRSEAQMANCWLQRQITGVSNIKDAVLGMWN